MNVGWSERSWLDPPRHCWDLLILSAHFTGMGTRWLPRNTRPGPCGPGARTVLRDGDSEHRPYSSYLRLHQVPRGLCLGKQLHEQHFRMLPPLCCSCRRVRSEESGTSPSYRSAHTLRPHQGPAAGEAEGRHVPYPSTLISNFTLNLISACLLSSIFCCKTYNT